jgi:predicted O-methyltransferase YrrM
MREINGLNSMFSLKYWISSPLFRLKMGLGNMFPELRLRSIVGKAIAICTQTTIHERLLLYDIARSSIQNGCFIEIGSYLGASAVVLAAAMKCHRGGRVYCVDTWQNTSMSEGARNTYDLFIKNTRKWSNIIVPIVGLSSQVEINIKNIIDFVFIDGDHSYHAVKQDIEKYGDLVRQGGFLALHDQAYYPSVTKALGDFIQSGGWYITNAIQNLIILQRDQGWIPDVESVTAKTPLKTRKIS